MGERKLERTICSLSLYRIYPQYGGPEEGGWYYDAYEHLCSTSFEANVVFEWHVFDPDDPNDRPVEGDLSPYEDDEGNLGYWRELSILEFERRWLADEARRLIRIYEGHDVVIEESRSDGDTLVYRDKDVILVKESNAGRYAKRPRPRYC